MLARCGATAMIDISDGLTLDLSRLCEASGAGARVELASLPVDAAATLEEALGGGEDYELLATLPDEASVASARDELREGFGVPLTQIGVVIGDGLVGVGADGVERPLEPRGWDHFA